MKGYEITLEDKGQDFTILKTDEKGIVIAVEPFQTEIWKGASIPISKQKIGDLCMIHHLPHIEYGYLKYKV
ncbi:hypothetical protein [Volucribacter amazonae]|uniref:Uncharacterized protein n=1 Tax=Volucribacter amazonae TaxID=256731 RepID=A0A9X4PEX1_9PAST|nr:hypothetical protein [Volucribacter amazonae]MDG6896394.1 hypothetical protein [Volucribacter amazonae]